MSVSQLIVGLGNPGPKYADTRHNVGFRAADAFANELGASFEHDTDAMVAESTYAGTAVAVAKPLTYMNRSGTAVVALCRRHDLSPADLIVVVDDLHLPVGTLRFRPDGSSGGHNGLAHVAQCLGTTSFPRLRIGIGNDFPDGEQVDYVLAPFTPDQRPRVERALKDAVEALCVAIKEDLDAAMNRFN